MKGLLELRRSSKVKYKWKPKKEFFIKPPTKVKITKKSLCRVMPIIVIKNIDKFLEFANKDFIVLEGNFEAEATRVKLALLSKN